MHKTVYIFLTTLLLTSCAADNDSTFLYISDHEAQIVKMTVEAKSSPDLIFSPIVYASQMIIDWGDGRKAIEYVNADSTKGTSNLKPLRYVFPSAGNYDVNIRAIKITRLDVSIDTARQSITNLFLSNCHHLKKLDCSPQSLKSIEVTSSGLKSVDFSNLPAIESFSLLNCDSLSTITLKDNTLLHSISLSNNSWLSATALNIMFLQLVPTTSDTCVITLLNNAGDEGCDKTIAERKGWKVKIE